LVARLARAGAAAGVQSSQLRKTLVSLGRTQCATGFQAWGQGLGQPGGCDDHLQRWCDQVQSTRRLFEIWRMRQSRS